MQSILILTVVAGTLVVASGCNRRKINENPDNVTVNSSIGADSARMMADSSMMIDSSRMMVDSTMKGRAMDSMMSDANILYALDHANMSDSAQGALAASKGTNTAVRSFGTMMITDHHTLRMQGQSLAMQLNITPRAPANDSSAIKDAMILDSLNAMPKGSAWDQTYMVYQITGHQKVLMMATKALNTTQNSDIKKLITDAIPIVQHHLEEAQRISGILSP